MFDKLKKMLANAHSPYSTIKVAAILETSEGLSLGVNVENAAFPSGICAERSAIFSAISQWGNKISFLRLHILSSLDKPLYPCGACLQVMCEFFNETEILIYGQNGEIKSHTLKDLIPYGVQKGDFGWK